MQIQSISNCQTRKQNTPSFKMNMELCKKTGQTVVNRTSIPKEFEALQSAFQSITEKVLGQVKLVVRRKGTAIHYIDVDGKEYVLNCSKENLKGYFNGDNNGHNDIKFSFSIKRILMHVVDAMTNQVMKEDLEIEPLEALFKIESTHPELIKCKDDLENAITKSSWGENASEIEEHQLGQASFENDYYSRD